MRQKKIHHCHDPDIYSFLCGPLVSTLYIVKRTGLLPRSCSAGLCLPKYHFKLLKLGSLQGELNPS